MIGGDVLFVRLLEGKRSGAAVSYLPSVLMNVRIGALLLCAVAALTTTAAAQETASGRADPGEIQRRLQQIEPQPPRAASPPIAPIEGAEEPALAVPPLSFVLTAVVVEGATVFEPGDFSDAYTGFLARLVTTSEVEEIAARITGMYADGGYFLSRAIVPVQEVVGGVLRVRVIEGHVADMVVSGEDDVPAIVDAYSRPVIAEAPARLGTVEKALLLLGRLPGYRVLDAQVSRIDDDGAYRLVVAFDYDPVDVQASLNNRGTREVGRLQAFTSLGFNSLAGLGERARVSLATVPDALEELVYGEASYEQPIGGSGLILGGSAAASRINAGGTLAAADTEARSVQVKGRFSRPLVLTRRQALYLRGSVEFHELDEERFGRTTIDDSLRIVRLQTDLTFTDDLGGTSYLAVEGSQGIGVFGASDAGDANLSRLDGDGNFTKLQADVIRIQQVYGGVSFRLAAQAQYAFDPLLSLEEFRVGGSQFGRAYDFGEISGEDGLAGSMELRYGDRVAGGYLTSYELYGFYDIGATWNRNVPRELRRQSLSSAGAGIRATLVDDVFANLEVTQPLTRRVAATGDNGTRVFFTLNLSF